MYRVTAICEGVSSTCGEEAARIITSKFAALGDNDRINNRGPAP